MEKESTTQSNIDEKGTTENNTHHEHHENVEEAIASNIQIIGGCGLGAVALFNNKPPKQDESDIKTKDDGMLKCCF